MALVIWQARTVARKSRESVIDGILGKNAVPDKCANAIEVGVPSMTGRDH
jgi:hypothetical protein